MNPDGISGSSTDVTASAMTPSAIAITGTETAGMHRRTAPATDTRRNSAPDSARDTRTATVRARARGNRPSFARWATARQAFTPPEALFGITGLPAFALRASAGQAPVPVAPRG